MGGKPVFSVPAKSVVNFKSAFSHKQLCDGLTFTAGSACQYSCSFCYVEAMMQKNPHWQAIKDQAPDGKFENVVIRREGAVEAVRKQITHANGKPRFGDPTDRRVIYASPLVDVAANMELVRETVDICREILSLTHWQIRLLSKSSLLPKVAEAIAAEGRCWEDRMIFGVSTGTLNDGLARAFEKGTALVSKRITSLHWLQDNGFRTYGMICPSLPQSDYRKFAEDMSQAIRSERCETVWSESINVRGDSFTRTEQALSDAGFHDEARRLQVVSEDKAEWEMYARDTFLAHAAVYQGEQSPDGSPKLKHLQYVTRDSRQWWMDREDSGAVLL